MLGAVVSYIAAVTFGLNFWLAMLVSMIVVGIIGVLMEKVFFKKIRNAPYSSMLILSIGLAFFLQHLVQILFGAEPRAIRTAMSTQIIRVFGTSITLQRLMIVIVGMALMVGLIFLINKTTVGKTMRATSQDRDAAMLMGININRVYTMTFFIGSAMAAAAGSLIAPILLVFPTMGADLFIKAFTVVVLAGLGSVSGIIFAGLFIGVAESLIAVYISTAYRDTFAFLILIFMLLLKPSGLMGGKN